ncbi:MAG: hypothetical protein LBH93_02350, partial [Chitinispirillales bacterium]|jgi:hypothetical protein|nr:hypothetical protein [Chitinispirillales bacterium]
MKGDSPISVSDGIKLINYGCFGNIKRNRERFEAVFGVNNYVGKHRKRAGSQEVTLDMIYDLIEIAKKYADALSITNMDSLKTVFQETLDAMEKIWDVVVDKSGKRWYIEHGTKDSGERKGEMLREPFRYINLKKDYLLEKRNKIQSALNEWEECK